jgi:hypothetical protein
VSRFYFDVRENGKFSRDDEGLECRDLKAAERMAAESAASLAKDELPKGCIREIAVEVRDERNRRLLRVTVAMTTGRMLLAA